MGGKVARLLLVAALVTGLVMGCGSSEPPAAHANQAAHADQKEKPGIGASASGEAASGPSKHEATEDQDSKDEHEEKAGTRSVTLTSDERTRLGITTSPAQGVTFTQSETAFAVVLSHDSIAQVVADLDTAAGAARLSQTALTRGQKLAAGPGALGVDTLETLEKQSSADHAALSLAQHKLTAVLGVRFPWQGAAAAGVLEALASGQSKLLRATFPAGVLVGEPPKSLRLVPLDPGAGNTWTASPVWEAPQDANLPGRSFFALIAKTDLPEGLRFQAVPGASNQGVAGVLIPAAAVVISSGQYWCYLEKTAGTFTRVSIDLDKPLGQGYFVGDGVAAGDQVVTSSAGLLLARETNASSEPDD
jgi:hypothetical protein